MEQHYTENKLVQLIYGECDLFDRLELEHSLESNDHLCEDYNTLYKAYRNLPKVKFSPKTTSIENILNYGSGRLESVACWSACKREHKKPGEDLWAFSFYS